MSPASPDTTSLHTDDRDVPVRVVEAESPVDAAVVIVPAMGVAARHYDRLAKALVGAGCHAVTVELPGCGDSRVQIGRSTEIGYQNLIDGEVATAVSFARRRWPSTPRVLVGHSLGGQLALLYTAAHPEEVDGVALLAAGTIHWRAYPPLAGLGVLAFTQLARVLATVAGLFPGDRLGFGGRQPRQLIHDWARAAITGQWRPAGATADYHQLLSRLHLPVLSMTLDGDRLAPASAAASLTAALPDRHVEHVRLSAEEVDGPVHHLRWLTAPEGIATAISTWLTAAMHPPRLTDVPPSVQKGGS